ncbi:MAG: hypothetical protein LUG99_15965 [Lachnospiraceae bacterium]|nr:hypothetical protein [Lachnospiraceae bacterium]
MIKDYISRLQSENSKKIDSLNQEMEELMGDLSCSEQLLDKLEQEKMIDTNIFSPRTIDTQVNERIDSKQKEIRTLKQKIEYVKERLEECILNQNEYNLMAEEIEKKEIEKKDIENKEVEKVETDKSIDTINMPDAVSYNVKENSNNENNFDVNDLKTFLKTIAGRAEKSLSYINGNKNRCRSEIQSVIRLIREYEEKIQ